MDFGDSRHQAVGLLGQEFERLHIYAKGDVGIDEGSPS